MRSVQGWTLSFLSGKSNICMLMMNSSRITLNASRKLMIGSLTICFRDISSTKWSRTQCTQKMWTMECLICSMKYWTNCLMTLTRFLQKSIKWTKSVVSATPSLPKTKTSANHPPLKSLNFKLHPVLARKSKRRPTKTKTVWVQARGLVFWWIQKRMKKR